MKTITFLLCAITWCTTVAQQDNYGITLGAHIPAQAENIPQGAKQFLLNKLGKIITDNGISDDVNNPRFILVPNVTVLSKNITPTAPPKIAYALEVTLYIGDGIGGNLFQSQSIMAKGVGTNELKAYTSAIKSINTSHPKIKKLINDGKNEILAYYDQQCDAIGKKAAALEASGQTTKALITILNIPEASNCFNQQNRKIASLYKKAINEDCSRKLNAAKALWAGNQDLGTANAIGELLASIEPRASCFSEVKSFYQKLSDRVMELSDRGWEYQLMELEVDKSEIEAARAIGVAFGTNQAQNVTYNTRGWF